MELKYFCFFLTCHVRCKTNTDVFMVLGWGFRCVFKGILLSLLLYEEWSNADNAPDFLDVPPFHLFYVCLVKSFL